MLSDSRISFQEAIEDPRLLKKHFSTLSRQQRSACKIFYGLPLDQEELLDWSVFQDAAEFDYLGYPTKIHPIPYTPKEYKILVAILGRRAGKTSSVTGTILAYEAALGGHEQYVSKKQDFQILYVAQDLTMASSHLKFIEAIFDTSPLLAKYVSKQIGSGIYLKNGLTIVPQPPTIKSSRGLAIPVVVMDEVGFWYTDSKSANPDFEVENAIRYAQLQFPFAKRLITSTPWTKEGLLWKYFSVGTEGSKIRCDECRRQGVWRCLHRASEHKKYKGVLLIHAPTAAMGNPVNTRQAIMDIQQEDPDVFPRESLAEFVDSISGFLPTGLIADAIDQKVLSRPVVVEGSKPLYVAAMDPAFRQDSFAFTVLHHDPTLGMVQDRFIQWTPTTGAPLNPVVVLDQVNMVLREFGISTVYSDQYQLESLQQLASDRNFVIIGCDFTGQSKAKIFGSLEMLVKQRRIRLLDDPTLFQQLVQLEKRKTPNGTVLISAPAGKHDDGPAVLALAVFQATWMLTPATRSVPKTPSHWEEGFAQIERNKQAMLLEDEE